MVTKTTLLDIGGTFIKRSDGQMFPIDSNGSSKAIAQALATAIGPIDGLSGIGIAIPGPFDFRQGIFLMEHKFASVYGKRFRELVHIPEKVQLVFHHDVNAVLLGSVKMLSLQRHNAALVTLGTGLGFAYALKGQVQYAPSGSPARNLWNLPVEEGGILEDYVSARGICRAYATMSGDKDETARSIAEKAYGGEKTARKVYESVGAYLGQALGKAIRDLDIDTVLIGGQIAQSFSLMRDAMQHQLEGIRLVSAPFGAVFEGLSSLLKTK